MTRTQGRRETKQPNCISLEDLVKPESMLGMYSNTFLLEWDFIAPLLPILNHPHAKRPVPVRLPLSLSSPRHAQLILECSTDPSRSTNSLRPFALARLSSSWNRPRESFIPHRFRMSNYRSNPHQDLSSSTRKERSHDSSEMSRL